MMRVVKLAPALIGCSYNYQSVNRLTLKIYTILFFFFMGCKIYTLKRLLYKEINRETERR